MTGNGNGVTSATKRKRLSALFAAFSVFAAFALVATVVGVAYLGLENNRQNDQIERLLRVTKKAAVGHQDAAKILIACNTPGRKCFEQQERQVAGYLDSIARSNQRLLVASFVCNDRPIRQRPRILAACVDDLLKR